MSKSDKLVPQLCFPEFVDSGEWVIQKLGKLTHKSGKKNKDKLKLPVYSIELV